MNKLAYWIAIILLAACVKQETAQNESSEKVEAQLVTTPTEMSVSGQVFVVTNARDNIKLALVEVMAFPETEIMQFIKAEYINRIEQQNSLLSAYEALKKEEESVVAEIARLDGEKTTLTEKHNTTELTRESAEEHYTASVAIIRKQQDLARKVDEKKSASLQTLIELDYFVKGEQYFEQLPPPMATAKTDADGKFTLPLPSGKYVIAAKTSRRVGDDTEVYSWLVSLDLTASGQTLMLSNDNQFQTKCKECIQPDTIP